MTFSIFNLEHWYDLRFDGRKKAFRGLTRETFNEAKKTHFERIFAKIRYNRGGSRDIIRECARRREDIAFFATVPYKYEGDGFDDFNMFQRPASNGVGYVAICPGESGNNYYTDDPILVRYLKAKYLKANADHDI